MDEFDYLKTKLVYKFDEFVKKGGHYWKTQEELADMTKIPIEKVECIIMFSGDFVKNSKGGITTREYYTRNTPLLKRIQDSCFGNIR